MDAQRQSEVRAAAYLAAQERQDFRGSRSRKTRSGSLHCTPPNKQCGGRCIPPSWDCRLKGEGQDNHTAATRTDPLAGIASIQRGAKDLARGVVTINPARVERGRNSVIRGVVKLTPGQDVQKKKELQRRLKQASTPVFAALGITLVGLGAHAGLKRGFASYRNGVGADIDNAARRAVNAVLDRTPGVSGNRAARRAAGVTTATEIATSALRGQRIAGVQSAATGNLGRLGPLSFRPNAANYEDSGLVNKLNALNARTREENLGYDSWQRSSVQELFGARNRGNRAGNQQGSVFSEHAANEFLISKFGLNGSGATGKRGSASMKERNTFVEQQVSERLSSWGRALREDMQTRGFLAAGGQPRSSDVSRYIREVGRPNLVGSGLAHLNAEQRRRMSSEVTDLMRVAIRGNESSLLGEARSMRRSLVSQYDSYFSEVAQGMRRNAAAADSPFGDGIAGLARYVTGGATQILSRDHADLILRNHYHVNVMRQRGDFTIGDNTARRIAQTISRSADLPTTENAYRILNQNGFPRLSRTGPAAGQAPPKLLTLTELTRNILERAQREGRTMSRAAAERQARAAIERRGPR